MNEQLGILIELQGIDSKILEKRRQIDEIPSKISALEKLFKESLTALDDLKKRRESLERKKREKERELDDVNEKIKKLKARSSEIKTNKEYQANLKEIEAAEKGCYALEEEILSIMEEIEAFSKEVKLQEEKIKADKDNMEAIKKELSRKMSECEEELLALKEARSKIVNRVERELYNQYMSLLEISNGVVITEAKKAVCQGCNMNIPLQLFVEIKKNEEIIQCPQCHRILYYKKAEMEESKVSS